MCCLQRNSAKQPVQQLSGLWTSLYSLQKEGKVSDVCWRSQYTPTQMHNLPNYWKTMLTHSPEVCQLPRTSQSQHINMPNFHRYQQSIQIQQPQHSDSYPPHNIRLMCAQPQSHSTHQTIRFIQHNTAKSTSVMQTLLHLARNTADIILIQEPWIRFDNNSGSWTTISHPSCNSILPPSPPHLKPRVAAFIARTATHISLTPRNDITNDPDVQCLSLSIHSTPPTLILNIYNEKSQAPDNNDRTIERCVANISLPDRAIAVGDFNAHHQWWNSNVRNQKRADSIISWTDTYHLQLLNEEDTPTYHYRNGTGTSVLDLTFATPSSTEFITSWAVDDEATTGSDHEVIRFEYTTAAIEDTVTHPVCQQFNFKKADWNLFSTSLSNLALDAARRMKQHTQYPTEPGLEEAATILRDTLLQAASEAIPLLRPSPRSKSWWNDDLTTKRRQMHQQKRRWKTTRGDQEWRSFQHTRNTYFHAIREAKKSDWQSFLSSAKGRDVFTAYKYTKPRRVERTPILNF